MASELWATAQQKLDRLDRARGPRDLADPPGNRLEPLRGDYTGFSSTRINTVPDRLPIIPEVTTPSCR